MAHFFLSISSALGMLFFSGFPAAVTTYGPLFVLPERTAPLKQSERSAEKWTVKKCVDFDIDGKGSNAAWEKTPWGMMTKIDPGGREYVSKFKILYSAKGIYLLFAGEDDKITTKDYQDFEEIYDGDVFEAFFHPVSDKPQYFEYEINQLDKELILVLAQSGGSNIAWAPWPHEYRNKRVLKRKVNVEGGRKVVNGRIRSWSAELFFPYSIFNFLPGSPPKSGDSWNANFCRIDYDTGKQVEWSWSPIITDSFHDLNKFGVIIFE